MKRGGSEGLPQGQDKAIIEKGKGELVVPQVEYSNLIIINDARKRLLPVPQDGVEEGIDSEFKESLVEFEGSSRQIIKKGLFRKSRWFHIPRENIIKGEGLFKRLEEERSQLPVMQTLSELRQTLNTVMEAAESVREENRVFLRYFFPTPITGSTATDIWEAVLPREDSLELLGGLLLKSKRTVPFRAHGKRHQTAESEDMKLAGPFLPPEMLEELAENIRLPAINMSENLRKAVELVSLLGESEPMGEVEREELKDASHLEFAVRVFNFSLLKMLEKPSQPEAGIFGILLETALAKIKNRLEKDIGGEEDYWYLGPLIPKIIEIMNTPYGSFLNYLEKTERYYLDRPYTKDEETGEHWPSYAAKRIRN